MNADTEEALLEAVARYAAEMFSNPETWTPESTQLALGRAGRAYLASLEPKPEPKRGVEDLISMASELYKTGFATIIDSRGTRSVGPLLDEALRLYREERERDEKRWEIVERVRRELIQLEEPPTGETCERWIDMLRAARERRDA